MEHVSKCCGRKYTIEAVRCIILTDGRVIALQTPGQIPEETPVCCGCHEPCGTVPKGEETRPFEGAVYCQTCARRIGASGRVPEELRLQYPASPVASEGTCWGCGKTVRFQEASTLVKR